MSKSLQQWKDSSNRVPGSFQFASNGEHAFQTGPQGFDPKKMIGVISKYKWIILLFIVMGATAAWFYAGTITPVYMSNGTILINPDDNSSREELTNIISQATGYHSNSSLVNELQILQSKSFSVQIAQKLFDDTGNNRNYPVLWNETEDGKTELASVEKAANRIRSDLMFYQPVEDSEVIKVSFQSTSPQETAEIVNLSMQNYIETSTRQNRQAVNSTANFLEDEKKEIKEKLEQAEQDLRSYMDATGIVRVDQQASGMVTQRANTEVELRRINLELQAVNKSIADYKDQFDRIGPGLEDQFSDAVGPRIRNAQEMLARYEQEHELILAKNPGVLDRDPLPARLQFLNKEISRLKKEIKNMSSKLFTSDNEFMGMNTEDRAQLVSNIQSRLVELQMQQNQLESRKQALSTHKNDIDADFNALPEGMMELAKLQRDVRINEELYLNVSRQYSDMSVWQQSQFGFGRIIDRADIPSSPVSPNRMIFTIFGIMLGGLFAFGLVVIKEFKDHSVNEVSQLKTAYFPPLTVIPAIEKRSNKNKKTFEHSAGKVPNELVMAHDKKSITSEAIRRLKNNIIYQSGDQPPKSIIITSPEKGDGKSTVAANLGIAFAEEGYWTLVIDADFRRSRLHTYFGLEAKNGLSNYLNNEISFEHLLKETDLETLKVLPAGKNIEAPEVLSNSAKFKRMLKKMEDVFDVIIVDTPPYGIISDSSAMLKYAEATVVVAQYRKTNKGMLFKTMQELKDINANVISIVLNNFDHKKEVDSYYGDGYYQTLYSNYDEYL